jgi:hypothetical protein
MAKRQVKWGVKYATKRELEAQRKRIPGKAAERFRRLEQQLAEMVALVQELKARLDRLEATVKPSNEAR